MRRWPLQHHHHHCSAVRRLHSSPLHLVKRKSRATFAPLASFEDASAAAPFPALDRLPTSTIRAPTPSPPAPSSPPPPTSSTPLTCVPPPHDLHSFLTHAHLTNQRKTSSVHIGTLYEHLVAHTLARAHFQLKHVGGRSDLGIDLLGSLNLPVQSPSPTVGTTTSPAPSPAAPVEMAAAPPAPAFPPSIPIFIQCKSTRRPPSPSLLRELEGAYQGLPASWRAQSAGEAGLGILVCGKPASKGIIEGLGRSRVPLGFAMVEVLEEEQEGDGLMEVGEGKGDGGPRVPRALLRQFLWNRAAAEEGGLGELGVTWRFFEGGEGQGNGGVVKGTGPLERELVFTLKGETIAPRIEGGPIFRDGGGEGENTIT